MHWCRPSYGCVRVVCGLPASTLHVSLWQCKQKSDPSSTAHLAFILWTGRNPVPSSSVSFQKAAVFKEEEEFVHARANEVNGILLLLCFDIWLPFGQVRVSPSPLPSPPLSCSLGRSTWPKWSPVVNTPIDSERFQAVPPFAMGPPRSHTSVMLSRAFHCRVGGRGCERERVHGRTGEFVL